jgi:putative exporter of polyketide antibiotics
LTRGLPAILIAALATGGAALSVSLASQRVLAGAYLEREIQLALAVFAGGLAYAAVTLIFRKMLPLGRLAR